MDIAIDCSGIIFTQFCILQSSKHLWSAGKLLKAIYINLLGNEKGAKVDTEKQLDRRAVVPIPCNINNSLAGFLNYKKIKKG